MLYRIEWFSPINEIYKIFEEYVVFSSIYYLPSEVIEATESTDFLGLRCGIFNRSNHCYRNFWRQNRYIKRQEVIQHREISSGNSTVYGYIYSLYICSRYMYICVLRTKYWVHPEEEVKLSLAYSGNPLLPVVQI